ncbi:hypothetical protein VB715_02205 [Crocosphaera sp. UHCC 0190]|uniref:arginine synthesis PII-interacting regulator PirA n=1 Tax=Crocosphaera sp. UHCC 0190 TaxID=3110246 RepID=UPI002B20678D|nr:hypothetical protein [Crocosphaera sp. UHCC 0190]MEA5508568.1 hypothetical protein [Crocosphaera sp. UHCC 0190]
MTHKQQHLTDADQVHRSNILKSLEHRLEIARAKGNESLIRQLEAEKTYYYR